MSKKARNKSRSARKNKMQHRSVGPSPIRIQSVPTDLYVPLVHGIGTTSEEAWTNQSLVPLRDWLLGYSSEWAPAACPAECQMPRSTHAHLVRQSSRGVRSHLVLEAIYWADAVERVQYVQRWVWLIKSILQVVALVSLSSIASAMPSLQQDGTAREMVRVYRSLAISLLTWLILPLLIIATPVLACGPVGGSRLDHALAWTHSDEARTKIAAVVAARIDSQTSPRMLVGHSQGGSILTSLENRRELREDDQLITLGSGHMILELLSRHKLRGGRWAVVVGVATVAYFLLLMLALLPTVQALVLLAATAAVTAGLLGASIYLLPFSPGLTMAALFTAANEGWGRLAWVAPYIFALDSLVILLPALAVGFVAAFTVRRRALLIRHLVDACTPSVEGFDVIGLRDPVSAPLASLNGSPRILPVPVGGSFLLDHVAYFSDRRHVLPALSRSATRILDGSGVAKTDVFCEYDLHESAVSQTRRGVWRGVLVMATVLGLGSALLPLSRPMIVWPVSILAGIIVGVGMWLLNARCGRSIPIRSCAVWRVPRHVGSGFAERRLDWVHVVMATMFLGAAMSPNFVRYIPTDSEAAAVQQILTVLPVAMFARVFILVGLGVGRQAPVARATLLLLGWVFGLTPLLLRGWQGWLLVGGSIACLGIALVVGKRGALVQPCTLTQGVSTRSAKDTPINSRVR